ncbi:MAG: hypothetical protein PHV21_03975, partial [Synergistaceae bacterium]|nr:hypothetical protein [Synergistaceae bacterium]
MSRKLLSGFAERLCGPVSHGPGGIRRQIDTPPSSSAEDSIPRIRGAVLRRRRFVHALSTLLRIPSPLAAP